MKGIPELFGSMVFNDAVMKEKLPKDTYKSLRKTIDAGEPLTLDVANVVASAMKDWAIEKGATHFTHWFQPMTGITAEKHDSFISPEPDGRVVMEFSGKELIKGEPDASSFPSGGLRATFEARGYTAWDPTSYAFIKDDTLCIPTAFCSYSGEALDKKTPLLRSMQAIDKAATRVLRLFGDTESKHVITTVGPEQEYFLIDRTMYEQRPDLQYTNRTLFGAKPPKGQELEDHYFGSIKQRVSDYMKDLDQELWKLGITAKTKHNEVAPAQHELAPIFQTTNVATDHNQLTMEMMKKVAAKHGLACLLHEKPFAGVNGSGKHNNWSIATDKGKNLLEPGKTPSQNIQFLFFLTAIIKAVDDYQELLRVSVANAGNDHRLGANEAPPAIMSVFVGEELEAILDSIEQAVSYCDRERSFMEIGAAVLPNIPKDNTDRNRTSPFAFTGNKFEFRSLGSTFSISGPNIILNTIVAESLTQMAEKLENTTDFQKDVLALIRDTIIAHKRIIFNGNGYSPEWVEEAAKRGLSNLRDTVDALPSFIVEENVELFVKHKVFSAAEVHSRYEILLENYSKTINIEALTLVDMVKKGITGSALAFQKELAEILSMKKSLGVSAEDSLEGKLLSEVSGLTNSLYGKVAKLEEEELKASEVEGAYEQAKYYRDEVIPAMAAVREVVDALEVVTPKKFWAYPTYAEMLFSVK